MSYPLSKEDRASQLIGIDLSGNVIPHSWYSIFQTDTKNPKPYLVAIVILSDILYWYKPVVIRDEETGEFVGYEKKYKDGLLQRNYRQFSSLLGLTENQAKRAVVYLEEKGVIKRIIKDIKLENGNILQNVMYLDLVVPKLLELTGVQICTAAPVKFAHRHRANLHGIQRLHTETTTGPLGEATPPPTGAPQESSNPPFVSKYSETKLHQRYGRFLKYRRDDDPDFKDPRLYHPALRIWRGAYKQDVTPKGNWRDRVVNKVGDREGHLKVWRTSIEVWTGISENPSPMRVLSIFDNGGVLNDREDFMRQQKAASQDDTVQGINPLSAEYMAERMKGWKGLQASGILDQKPKFKEATT